VVDVTGLLGHSPSRSLREIGAYALIRRERQHEVSRAGCWRQT